MSWRSLVLVEDDAGDTLLVTEMLADVAPHVDLRCFTTVQAALEGWPADADCVLLDLGLPDAMGLSALNKIRDRFPDVPIVVLTGRSDDGIGPESLAAGAQDYLVKGEVDGLGLERSVRYAVERVRAALDRRNLMAAEMQAQENARLQRGLLPTPLLGGAEVGLASFYRPGGDRAPLGGDFFDVVETATGVHLVVGDVCGHGPDEAALGVALRIAWRTLVLAGHAGADVVQGVEQLLLAERHDDARFATIAMVSVDPHLRRAELLLCGHPAPLLVSGDDVREVTGPSLPMLSLLGGRAVEAFTIDLEYSWGLLLFTDGLFEGRAAPGASARLGVDELARQLQSLVTGGVARTDIASALVDEAERRNGGPLNDDVAVLLVGSAGWWA